MRFWTTTLSAMVLMSLLVGGMAAQETPPESTTTCTFADGKQMSVRYPEIEVGKKGKLPDGDLWLGESPMVLFTQTELTVANGTAIPVGAYRLYVIPEDKEWTLVINRDVEQGAAYNRGQDLVRLPMKIGTLSQPVPQFMTFLGRVDPRGCELRLNYGATMAWVGMAEK